jgi:hypothetical protein
VDADLDPHGDRMPDPAPLAEGNPQHFGARSALPVTFARGLPGSARVEPEW